MTVAYQKYPVVCLKHYIFCEYFTMFAIQYNKDWSINSIRSVSNISLVCFFYFCFYTVDLQHDMHYADCVVQASDSRLSEVPSGLPKTLHILWVFYNVCNSIININFCEIKVTDEQHRQLNRWAAQKPQTN
jgi:hypothetical protein